MRLRLATSPSEPIDGSRKHPSHRWPPRCVAQPKPAASLDPPAAQQRPQPNRQGKEIHQKTVLPMANGFTHWSGIDPPRRNHRPSLKQTPAHHKGIGEINMARTGWSSARTGRAVRNAHGWGRTGLQSQPKAILPLPIGDAAPQLTLVCPQSPVEPLTAALQLRNRANEGVAADRAPNIDSQR